MYHTHYTHPCFKTYLHIGFLNFIPYHLLEVTFKLKITLFVFLGDEQRTYFSLPPVIAPLKVSKLVITKTPRSSEFSLFYLLFFHGKYHEICAFYSYSYHFLLPIVFLFLIPNIFFFETKVIFLNWAFLSVDRYLFPQKKIFFMFSRD